MRRFMEVVNNIATGLIVNECGIYKNKRYGKNSPDSTYIADGLYPFSYGLKPLYNNAIESLLEVHNIVGLTVVIGYTVIPRTPEEIQQISYIALKTQLESLTVTYELNEFSGNNEAQAFIVSHLAKIEGEIPQSTRNVYTVDGATRVPLTKTGLNELLSVIDVAQEAITNT